MTEILALEEVSLSRGGLTILDQISWRVLSGEHWVVMGPNGSGKTTLLNLLAGYLWPSRGKVRVLGETYGQTDVRTVRRRIGWVGASLVEQIARYHGEDPARAVVLSGSEASIGLYRRPEPREVEAAEELLAELDAAALAERPFSVLSQGERQKVALARAWFANPAILVLDEPANGLDLATREGLLQGLTRLARRTSAPSVVYVTHRVEEVLPWFTHALVLNAGKVVASGRKRAVLTDGPLSRAFGIGVEVVWRGDRPWLTIA